MGPREHDRVPYSRRRSREGASVRGSQAWRADLLGEVLLEVRPAWQGGMHQSPPAQARRWQGLEFVKHPACQSHLECGDDKQRRVLCEVKYKPEGGAAATGEEDGVQAANVGEAGVALAA